MLKWPFFNESHRALAGKVTSWCAANPVDTDGDLDRECRRLVKGYSDTHARGLSKFDRVLAAVKLVAAREDAAEWAARLREAALKDEDGKALDGAIATIRSFL